MHDAASVAGRIGPNAIIRVAEALPPRIGEAATRALFERAGLAHYVGALPGAMVLESEVRQLHGAVREALAPDLAREVLLDAGRRTGEYLLAHRIPRPVQRLLKWLPAPLAARVLLAAIGRNAWTFVGSGRFTAEPGQPVVLHIADNPLCAGLRSDAPACHFYAATFERLFGELVHPRATVREVACQAAGAGECRFEVRW